MLSVKTQLLIELNLAIDSCIRHQAFLAHHSMTVLFFQILYDPLNGSRGDFPHPHIRTKGLGQVRRCYMGAK